MHIITLLAWQAVTCAQLFDRENTNYGDPHKVAAYFQEHNTDMKTEIENGVPEDLFFFFSIHDYNRDGHLDGSELFLAYAGYEFADDKTLVNVNFTTKEMEAYIGKPLLNKTIPWPRTMRTTMERYLGQSICGARVSITR